MEGVSSFLLGGRAWWVLAVDHGSRRVRVEVAPRGRQPTWGGHLPQFLGWEVCQAQLAVLTGTDEPAYLHASARELLRQRRAAFEDVLSPGCGGLEEDADGWRWWTFAGGRINGTLRHALAAAGGDWQIVPDNHHLRLKGPELDRASLRQAWARLREPSFWGDARLWKGIIAELPSYRLSKFQPLMPPSIQREWVAHHLLDLPGAQRLLSGRLPGE